MSSTRLILESMGRSTGPARMRDSMYFVIPMLTPRAARVERGDTGQHPRAAVRRARRQAHLRAPAHLQVYGYNDIMLAALAKRLPLGPARLERALRPAARSHGLIQGFLHSDDSPGLTFSCEAGNALGGR